MGEELEIMLLSPPSLVLTHLADLHLCSFSQGQLLMPMGSLWEPSVPHPETLSSRDSFLPSLKPITNFGD